MNLSPGCYEGLGGKVVVVDHFGSVGTTFVWSVRNNIQFVSIKFAPIDPIILNGDLAS